MFKGFAEVTKGAAAIVAVTLIFSITWYMLYVKERDEVFAQIMLCMEDDSRQEYDRCVEHLRPEK
jgi:hypothetical protein|tara:strand:- start:15661 stop:15855 length:195 start_codon:yes stop_codon:yes gene_type:complete